MIEDKKRKKQTNKRKQKQTENMTLIDWRKYKQAIQI
jgi:hypothetical protein